MKSTEKNNFDSVIKVSNVIGCLKSIFLKCLVEILISILFLRNSWQIQVVLTNIYTFSKFILSFGNKLFPKPSL